MDAEWGLGMRLQDVEKFPYQMTLGAITDDSLIYKMGKMVAQQCKRLGVHVNLAPVADINNNPANPVINYRSFGENKENVAHKAMLYMKGMQDNGVSATLKHFPGHGDTNVDSHYDLPVITHSRDRLESIELYPFVKLIDEGAGCVMTAHLNLPAVDATPNLPATLSPAVIKQLLIKDLGFKGLVITDAMNMKGVTKYFKAGEAEALAFMAGNDVVEFVTDIESAIRETMNMIASKKILPAEIDMKCRKVLALKYWSGLSKPVNINKENIIKDLNPQTTLALIRDLYANSLTVIQNNNNIIPLKNPGKMKIAALAVNKNRITVFQKRLLNYCPADTLFISAENWNDSEKLLSKLAGYDLVIAGVFGTSQSPSGNFGIKPELNSFLEKLSGTTRTIIAFFGNPYALDKLKAVEKAEGLIVTYQENSITEDLSAQLIYGGIGGKGVLPVTINQKWRAGHGIITRGDLRLKYGLPENAGLSSEKLNRNIDSIALAGLKAKAYPGCQVMVARKGIVVFWKTYGFHTYENRIAVREDDLFDLASVTKVSSTLAGLMLLDSEGKFSPDKTLGEYVPFFRNSNKEKLMMKDILTHQAGLTAWIPFWRETVKNDSVFRKNIFSHESSRKYPLEVADGLFINKKYRHKIFNEIKKSPLGEKKYVYSDLAFIISPEIIEQLTGEKWYEFVTLNVYHKIGAFDMVFNPYMRYPLSRIVPTEYDSLFRKQLLHGTVHDEGAAMLGGISGHAGLFSTANDLMKLMELYRRMGEYGGERIISEEVMKRYTSVQFPENNNRRGLGFDKPLLNNSELSPKDAYPSKSASMKSFGHSGYTGTFVWIDPVYDISYVFLSNRVYPTRNNNLLSDMNIRSDILESIYKSITD
ncbi:MAG: serine hydrolase [Bacteroidales bacterium]|nr:serine hydrolase [Bacteroidales bacterium]